MKRAMIWGGSGGIGSALVHKLVAEEWQVFAISRHPDRVADVTPHTIVANVADEYAVQNAVMSVGFEVEAVDLWIYAAGDIAAEGVADMPYEAWQRILAANLTGAYLAAHHSLPLMTSEAHLFFIGAVSERLRLPGLSAYAAAKAGLEAFVDALRKELRRQPITLVRPGAVDTALWDKVPMKVPRDAASPAKVADRIMQAYLDGQTGQLDLT